MVPRVACMEATCAKSFRFPENPRQGAPFREHTPSTEDFTTSASILQERTSAKALFLTADDLPTALATTLSTTVSEKASKTTLTIDEPQAANTTVKAGRLMSKEDAEKVKAAIAKATTIEEVRKLERSLREGYIPEMESVGA